MNGEARSDAKESLEGFKLVFRTLRYRNYRLFFGGQLVSLVGTWMQQVAVTWLVYRLTNSAFLLGVVGFAGQMPTFLLSPFAGVIADRHNRHRLLLITQTLSMVQAAALAALTFTGTVAVWQLVTLSIFLGIINAFDIPTRQTFVLDMLESKDDLANAIALNSSMFNGARLVGPSIAGLIIAALGEGPCFLLNAVSYVAVIGALLAMKITPQGGGGEQKGVMEGFREGFRHAFGFPPIRSILLLIALVSMVGVPFSVLMPVFAKDILHGGADTMGFLMAAVGLGALTGALTLASRRSVRGLSRWIPVACGLFGAGLVGFSLSKTLWLSTVLLFVAGYGMMVQMASSNTILQTVVDDDKRGRVMSLYTASFMGMIPFGSFFAGSVAAAIGAPWAVFISGIACIAGGAVFAWRLPTFRKYLRPVYARLGIIPEISSGLESTSQLTAPPEQ